MFTYKLPSGAAVDVDALCEALESSNNEASYYLDIETGEILRLPEFDLPEEDKEVLDLIASGSNRYVYVEPIASKDMYEQMHIFTESIIAGEDELLAKKLRAALNGTGAFRRFKNVLNSAGDCWIFGWYQWVDDFLFEEAQRFLAVLPLAVTEKLQLDDDCPLCKMMQNDTHQHVTEFSQRQELFQNVRKIANEKGDTK